MDRLPAHLAPDVAIVNATPVDRPLTVGELADLAAKQHAHQRYSQGKARNTNRRQRADLALFFQCLAEQGYELPIVLFDTKTPDWSLWRLVTFGLVESFIQWQQQRGYAIASINSRLSSVKTYCTFAYQAGAISEHQARMIAGVKGLSRKEGIRLDEKRPVSRVGEKKAASTVISYQQAQLLKRQPNTPQGRKDAALLTLLLDHGLRCGELARLHVEHINLAKGCMVFYREKVAKTQRHNFTLESYAALQAYLPDVRGPYLFPGYKGRPMSTRGINKRVGELGRAIGIENLSPHDLRHYWATRATEQGTDTRTLQEAGGWNSEYMPLRYKHESETANAGVKL